MAKDALKAVAAFARKKCVFSTILHLLLDLEDWKQKVAIF